MDDVEKKRINDVCSKFGVPFPQAFKELSDWKCLKCGGKILCCRSAEKKGILYFLYSLHFCLDCDYNVINCHAESQLFTQDKIIERDCYFCHRTFSDF